MSKGKKAILIIISILIVDQIFKIWIKTHLTMGQTIPVIGKWFLIRFIENPGMAFGLDIPGKLGKPVLTVFRMIAVIFIGWYLYTLIKKKAPEGLIICLSLILAGAFGNIIDSAFYGLIFSESTYYTPSVIFPKGGGYAPFLYGRVVDMLYFPIIETHYPGWVPWVGGEEFIFFRPIFNIADSAISVGVVAILIFQKRFFKHSSQ
jgi:signal peptidase II